MKRIALAPACSLVLVTGALTACAYIIPPDPNIPRNNTVQGEIRKPQLNPGGAPALMPMAGNQPPREARDAIASAPLPPVAPAPEPVVTALAEPAIAPAPAPPQYRMTPAENESMQLAGNYPSFDNVPPRPVTEGPESTKQRLSETRTELEQSREAAEQQKNALARDAASEPSMLSDLPPLDTTPAPTPPPVALDPLPTPAPVTPMPPTSAVVEPEPPIQTARVEPLPVAQPMPPAAEARIYVPVTGPAPMLPASSQFAPPPPRGGMPAPVAKAAPKPVSTPETLMPQTASAPVAAAAPIPSTLAGIKVQQGDFDPLATDDAAAAPVSDASAAPASSARPMDRPVAPSRYYQ